MRSTSRGLFLGLFVVALLAACTSSAAGPGVATLEESQAPGGGSPAPSLSPEDAMLAYARCMRENGVDMPDPQVDAKGGGPAIIGGTTTNIDKGKFAKADEACRGLLSAVMNEGGKHELSPEDEEKLLQFARCMRENGIDFPDPGAGGFVFEAGPSEGKRGYLNDPDFEAAQEACGDLLPGRIGVDRGTGAKPGVNIVPDEQVAP